MGNSTIANNSAGGNGGGIGASGGSSTSELGGDTVARNLAGPGHVGGGLYQGNGDVIGVQDTIVALNLGGTAPDCASASSGSRPPNRSPTAALHDPLVGADIGLLAALHTALVRTADPEPVVNQPRPSAIVCTGHRWSQSQYRHERVKPPLSMRSG